MKKRVVITGLGIVSPLGLGVKANEEALFNGRAGVDLIKSFIPDYDFPVKIAGEVKGFDPKDYIDHKEIKKMDRFIHYAMACSCLLYTSPSPRDKRQSRMPSSA